MDGGRLDALAKALGGGTRRGVLGALAAVAASVVPARVGVAECKGQGAKCKQKTECCTEVCKKFGKKKKCWCKRLGEVCEDDTNCCALPAGMACETASDFCSTGFERHCCMERDGPCGGDCDCCGTDYCELNGICTRCRNGGAGCGADSECCSGECIAQILLCAED